MFRFRYVQETGTLIGKHCLKRLVTEVLQSFHILEKDLEAFRMNTRAFDISSEAQKKTATSVAMSSSIP